MNRIIKYEIIDGATVSLPANCVIRTSQLQEGKIVVWVHANPSDDKVRHVRFHLVFTGVEIPYNYVYIATIQKENGIVIHVHFEILL